MDMDIANGTDAHAGIGRWRELFERDVDHRYVSEELTALAAALIDGIGREAAARGFTVEAPSARLFAKAKHDKWAWPHIMIAVPNGHLLSFHISERSRTGTGPKTRALADRRSTDGTPTWQTRRSMPFVPTGTLSIKVDSDMDHYRVKTGKDSPNTTIETRLPNLFDAITGELVRCDEVNRLLREQRERDEAAKQLCYADRMYASLCTEVALYERLNAQRAYLDLVEKRLDSGNSGDGHGTGDDGSTDIRMAIETMRAHIDARDPLSGGGTNWANQPEPTETELYEYAHRAVPAARHRPIPSVPSRGMHERRAAGPRSVASGRSGFFD